LLSRQTILATTFKQKREANGLPFLLAAIRAAAVRAAVAIMAWAAQFATVVFDCCHF